MTLIRPSNDEVWLSCRARELAIGLNPLFHGTRYLNLILSDGCLKPARVGPGVVAFSRSADTAAYWATMERDDDDDRGAILVFDRERLRTRYRLELIDDSVFIAEQEEFISARDVPLSVALVGVIGEPFPIRTRVVRQDVWHRRVHGIGILPRREPSKEISLRTGNMPREELRRLTRKGIGKGVEDREEQEETA